MDRKKLLRKVELIGTVIGGLIVGIALGSLIWHVAKLIIAMFGFIGVLTVVGLAISIVLFFAWMLFDRD